MTSVLSCYCEERQDLPLTLKPEADIFDQTEDEVRADEAWWDQQFAVSRDELKAMAREAAAEYRAGRTKPMGFTLEGRLAR
jgi:sarcosine oxidase delta subunit